MAKPKSNDYKNGYGDCKADLLRMVSGALTSLRRAAQDDPSKPEFNPSPEDKQRMKAQEMELRRLRAMVKALKPAE